MLIKNKGFSNIDRLARLISIYLFRKGTIKKAWTHEGIVNKPRCKSKDIMLGYFLDFSKDANYQGPFDSKGVPLIDYTGRIGRQYNPWYVGHYALSQFEKYRLENHPAYLEKFLTQAEWFKNTAVYRDNGKFAVWEYKFDWSKDLKAPWISALSQAHGLSVLIRAYKLTQDISYLKLSEKVFQSFCVSIKDGGVLNTENGLTIFEEAPVLLPDTVLNGYIFSIWAVLEYAQFFGEKKAYDLYQKALDSLIQLLPKFELPFWSKYSIKRGIFFPPISSLFYHRVHIVQLKALYEITDIDVFKTQAIKWENCYNSFFKRNMAFILKIGYKLFNK